MRILTAILFVSLVLAGSAAAREVQITVYNDDLGLVRDVRDVELPAGAGDLSVTDVAARIDPTSVHLQSLTRDGGITVLEQNYRYDLASPDRILERYLDTGVQAILEGGELHEGKLLSFTNEQLVLMGDKGLSILQRAKVIDVRCPSLPEGLITKPTLVWSVDADRAGPQKAELSYLTNGISWHAEYVAIVNDTDSGADLAGWVSVDNQSGATYPDAKLQLIAGDVNRVQPQTPAQPMLMMEGRMAKAADAGFQEESFFEYHLYTLPRATTIRDRETKQIALFPPAQTPVVKLYEYKPWSDEKKVRTVLQFENREDRGLGMPLPKGKVRTYKRDSRGGQQFIGEDWIDHTPKDEKVRLFLGNAFDIVAERTMKDQNRISDRVWEQTIEVKFRNHKKEKVTIVAGDRFWGDWTIVTTSLPSRKKDANTAEWMVDVGPDAEVVLTYTVRMGS
jgi:hypothetical protein